MHYFACVILPNSIPLHQVEEEIDRLIAPYNQDTGTRRGGSWDDWRIGGRYDGLVQGERRPSTDNGYNTGREHERIENNILRVKDWVALLRENPVDRVPYVLVTPEGDWLEAPSFPYPQGWIDKIVSLPVDESFVVVGIDIHS